MHSLNDFESPRIPVLPLQMRLLVLLFIRIKVMMMEPKWKVAGCADDLVLNQVTHCDSRRRSFGRR